MKTAGEQIKVGLPGESLWAEVKGHREDGCIVATLANESIHDEFQFGDEVVLDTDEYTVIEPRDKVEAVKQAIERWRSAHA